MLTNTFRPATVWFGLCLLGLVLAFAPLSSDMARAESDGSTWADLKPDVFGDRKILPAGNLVELNAPTRPDDQRAVPVVLKAHLADGRTIKSVTFVVDENPSPVAAVFKLGPDRTQLNMALNLRFNTGTALRAIVEASDGALYMTSRHVKFAGGQAACSAPPTGNPEDIAANMGKMSFVPETQTAAATVLRPKAQLKISHPNHTGMALDQQTLLYIPLRMISNLEVKQGDERVFEMTGSITLSENPEIDFDYRTNGAQELRVVLADSDGTSWEQAFPIGSGS